MRVFKFLVITFFVFIMFFGIFNYSCVQADTSDPTGDIISDADNFLNKSNETFIAEDDMVNFSNKILNILIILGEVIAVIVGIVLGIQYLLSSVEEKAKSKQNLVVYVIGCMVLFGAYGIWRIIIQLFNLF